MHASIPRLVVTPAIVGTFLFFVLLALFALGPQRAFAAGNLVQNGDLETSSSTSTSTPLGWNSDFWGTLTATFTYPVPGMGGGSAAQVSITKYTSGDAKWYFNNVPVTPGTVYQLSDNYSSNVVTEIDVDFHLSNGTESYAWISNPAATAAGAWGTFSGQVTAPTGAVSMTVFHFIQSVGTLTIDNMSVSSGSTTPPLPSPPPPPPTPSCLLSVNPQQIKSGSSTTLGWTSQNTLTASLDNGIGAVATSGSKIIAPTATTTYTLSVFNGGTSTSTCTTIVGVTQAAPPPPPPPSNQNLITNGNLEAGTTNAPQGWQNDYWGSLKFKFTYPVAGMGGGKAAQVIVTNWRSGDAKWYFNHVPVSSHTMYLFTDNYIANVPTNISVEYLLANGTYDYEWVEEAPATGATWGQLSAEITVPANAVSLTVLHTLDKNGTLTIDNASLVAQSASPFVQGMVTLAFDDGTLSQYQSAMPILTAAKMPATFYIITSEPASGDSGYMTWAQIHTVANQGIDIGSHTQTHAYLAQLTAAKAQQEIAGSYNALVAQGFQPKTLAYPFGDESPAIEQLTKAAGYLAARGSYYGLNAPFSPRYDLNDLRVDQTVTLAQVEGWIDQSIADKRWLVLEFHDVLASGGDGYQVTPAMLQNIVNYLKQKNVAVVTAAQGIQYLTP